jgi:uncharacterized protein
VWDELDEPLGFVSSAVAVLPAGRKRPTREVAIGLAIVAIAVGLIILPRRDLSINGEPFALTKVEVLPTPPTDLAPNTTASVRQPVASPAASAEQMEAMSGVKVTRGSGGPPKPLIIDVARALGVRLAPAPDPRLVEKSNYGLLPRIGADGARAIDIYARAVVLDPWLSAGSPRIALMVGGLGPNADATQSAIAKLPSAITLGFAPTGATVEQQAAQAREAGHETVLQAWLGEASVSPGELGADASSPSASGVDNLDSLRWQMGRFTGYVAVVNDPGKKSLGDRRTVAPILEEIARRGLGYLDDGASPTGMTNDLTASATMLSAHADVVIDANATPEAVEAALSRLVELARRRGAAIGVASATTGSVERLARWGNELEAKGIALVPLSALMSGPQERSVQLNRSLGP